jgi:hypothetical protein
MKQYLALLDKVIGDTKTLSRTDFEKEYKEHTINNVIGGTGV